MCYPNKYKIISTDSKDSIEAIYSSGPCKIGIDACIEKIPAADHYLITIDADVFDTAIAPGVLFPSPGGLTFDEITYLVRGIARKGSIVGVNLFEIRPELDINNLTASTGAQLIINFIGTLAHSGQIGK